ncbi:MAG: hypothetical protein ACYTXE_14675 [Nostoc sp.]
MLDFYEEGEGGKVKTSPEVKRNNPNFMRKVKTSPFVGDLFIPQYGSVKARDAINRRLYNN